MVKQWIFKNPVYVSYPQGIEKSKLNHVEIIWIDPSESVPLVFTQLQEAFMKLPEDRFKKVQIPAYQVSEDGQTHVLFMGDKQ